MQSPVLKAVNSYKSKEMNKNAKVSIHTFLQSDGHTVVIEN